MSSLQSSRDTLAKARSKARSTSAREATPSSAAPSTRGKTAKRGATTARWRSITGEWLSPT